MEVDEEKEAGEGERVKPAIENEREREEEEEEKWCLLHQTQKEEPGDRGKPATRVAHRYNASIKHSLPK